MHANPAGLPPCRGSQLRTWPVPSGPDPVSGRVASRPFRRSPRIGGPSRPLDSYGYDPLGLGESTEKVEQFREYELLHARWAMLGAFGAFVPEGIAANGGDIPGAVWFEARAWGKTVLHFSCLFRSLSVSPARVPTPGGS